MSHSRRKNDTSQSSLACVVPKQNVEILTRALHALARIGEELFVEPVESGLVFRTVHANHSVYAEALFMENFFTFFKITPQSENAERSHNDEDKLNCRITMKSCLLAFRSVSWIKRQVETCLLTIEPTYLTIKFRCNHGFLRSHMLPVIESESLQAFYTEDEAPNVLAVGPKTFASVIKNFQSSERDITLAVDSDKALLQNFAVGGTDSKAVVRSQLKMEKAEFESFKVENETNITFSLKAFRAALFFADQAEYSLIIKFSTAGSPVIVINTSPVYELRFILSSLAPDECDVSRTHSQQMLTPLRNVAANKQTTTKKQGYANDVDRQSDSSFNCSTDNPSQLASMRSADADPSSSNRSAVASRLSLRRPAPESQTSTATSQRTPSQTSVASTTGACVGSARGSDRPARSSDLPARGLDRPSRQQLADKPVPSGLRWQIEDNSVVVPQSDDEDEERDDDDVLPGTPPLPQPKKSRQFFQRCFEPTINRIDLPDDTVLAEDSD